MKTITFYSYKGGVGRSLVLANLAQRLAEFGKSVCMLDFDLEAPGLPFKFDYTYILSLDKKGVVDFVIDYQKNKKPATELSNAYYISLNDSKKYQKPLYLITAGNTNKSEYWKNLASIDWKEMFYSEHGRGYELMLHLKARIQKEIEPDYLLIDSRTGVTESSGITLSILGDELVVVAANNKENIYGSTLIMKSCPKEMPIHFVLSRVPYTSDPNDRLSEKKRITELLNNFSNEGIQLQNNRIHVLHSDRELEEIESLKISEIRKEIEIFIGDDYRSLFKNIFSKDFSEVEKDIFDDQEKSNELFADFLKEKDKTKRLELINTCIDLYQKPEYYQARAALLQFDYPNISNADEDYKKAIELDPSNPQYYYELSLYYLAKSKKDESIKYLNHSIDLFPYEGRFYFLRALYWMIVEKNTINQERDLVMTVKLSPENVYYHRLLAEYYFGNGEYDKSFNVTYKALTLHPNDADSTLLLSKLYYVYKNNLDEFYLNINRALSLDSSTIGNKISKDDFFLPFSSDDRFKDILYKYNIKMKAVDD